MSAHSGALEAIERILNLGGAPDEVLGAATKVLTERLGREVRISRVMPGTAAGNGFPIRSGDAVVATLEADGELDEADRTLLERVALLISPYAGAG